MMITSIKRAFLILFAVILVLSFAFIALPVTALASSKQVISETLNIADARRNLEGPGYIWANRDSILTLDGININTESAYGLRLPKDCTVVLEGNNYIKAGKYGISCSGTVVFKGDGTLTIDAGEAGIYLISQNNTHKVRLIEGKYIINAGKYGVLSEYADFSFVGKSMSVTVGESGGFAINGRCVNLLGGTFAANAPVVTLQELVVDSINLDINASSAALSSPSLRVENIDIDGSDVYNGETAIRAKAMKRFHAKSIIFDGDVPGYVDYILLAGLALVIGAGIVLPILHKKHKNKKLRERLKMEGYTD